MLAAATKRLQEAESAALSALSLGERAPDLQEKALSRYEDAKAHHAEIKKEVEAYSRSVADAPAPLPATELLNIIRELRANKLHDRLRSLLRERVQRIVVYTRYDDQGKRQPHLKLELWMPPSPEEAIPLSLQNETLVMTNLILHTRRK